MKRFVDAQMPDFVEKIKEPKDYEKFEDKANRNQLPRVLLFSSKPNTSPLTKYLSVEYRRRMLLAEIKPNKRNEEIIQKYGVTSMPALIIIPPSAEGGEEAEPIRFDGAKFTRNALHGFIAKHSLKDPVLTVKKKADAKPDADTTQESSKESNEQASSEKPPKRKAHEEF